MSSPAFEKLRELLWSGDAANVQLARTLAQSQNIPQLEELYQTMLRSHDYWKNQLLNKFPTHYPEQLLPYFQQQGFDFFKIYELREIPKEQDFLIPFIRRFYVWYLSLSQLPEGLGRFTEIESIEVSSGDLKSVRDEVWSLPKLRSARLHIVKNFNWEKNLLNARSLEDLRVSSNAMPALPDFLDQLPNLKSLAWNGNGNPKDAIAFPSCIHRCRGLRRLDLSGKPLLELPPELVALQALESLRLFRVNIPALPDWVAELPELRHLELAHISHWKTLPEWLAESRIESLYLGCKSNNAFQILTKMRWLKSLKVESDKQKNFNETQWKEAFGHIELEFV